MIDGNESTQTSRNKRFATAGSITLGLGLVLILARALETAAGIPGLPRSWYQNDWLWWLVGLVSIGVGSRLLIRSESFDLGDSWRPSQPGRRFHELVLYTRDGCHLCDDAEEILQHHRRWLPPATLINVDSDPKLVDQFGTCVPVVALDGKVRFRGHVNEALLRRLIEGTPPVPL